MFKKATKQIVKLKLAVTGPSGSGKTYSALRLARGIVGDQGKIAYLDTENRSASLYSDKFDFDVCSVEPPFSDHSKFTQPIQFAVREGYDIVVIDSASHFWEGILDYKTKLDRRGGSSYTNWADAGEHFKDIIDAILQSNIHVIVCLRSKMDYVLEENRKRKMEPRKVGLAPIMRDGIEYEFTTVFDLDIKHSANASKDRTGLFADKFFLITEDTGKELVEWMSSGAAPAEPEVADEIAESETVSKIEQAWKALKKNDDGIAGALKFVGSSEAKTFAELTQAQANKLLVELQKQMNRWADEKKAPKEPSSFKKDDGPNGQAMPAEEQDDVPMHFAEELKDFFEPNEEEVNKYLISVNWIKEGQTWRDLSSDKVEKIKVRKGAFIRAVSTKGVAA